MHSVQKSSWYDNSMVCSLLNLDNGSLHTATTATEDVTRITKHVNRFNITRHTHVCRNTENSEKLVKKWSLLKSKPTREIDMIWQNKLTNYITEAAETQH